MPAWLKAALSYFAAVFALGFVLGTVRTLVLLPRLSELAAVLMELPLMLAASWWLSLRLVARWHVPAKPAHRLAMGGGAFLLLMIAEWVLATLLFGLDSSQWLGRFTSPAGALGLAGQTAFGLIPLIQMHGAGPRQTNT